ncbi:MAG: TonB-dependent receptor plug domain-containing protein [Bacteroidales bacterium]
MLKSTSYLTNFKKCAQTAVLIGAILAPALLPAKKAAARATDFPAKATVARATVLPATSDNNLLSNKEKQDSTAILLKEITISAGVENVRKSPLRLKSISADEIQALAPGKTYPELLKNIPGIFATSETGSYGDAKINIRGFKQENISVLLNGTPISGLTSGSMFWNNWLGLTDATATIQVQKGIGGSMLSDNSVGGTINIISKSPGTAPSYDMGYSYTNDGTSKGYINYNSGTLNRGWAISLLASYTWGSSWVECSKINSWSYMASVSKKINKRHSLLFTALGSPEEHEQRSTRLSYADMEQYGRKYNKNWGYYTDPNGNVSQRTINKNNYFKPYFTLNHFYNTKVGKNADKNFTLSSALYLTIGNGGGYWTESTGKRIIDYQKDGHIDWESVYAANKTVGTNAGNANSSNGINGGSSQDAAGSAQNIMSDYMAGHTQFGVKSSFLLDLSRNLNLDGGVHYQYYSTWEKEKITDLLGGEYWYENYEKNSLMGGAGRNPIKKEGDYIRTHNGKTLNYGTIYGMLTYSPQNFIIKLGGSLSGSTHQRWDKYNYPDTGTKKAGQGIYSKVAHGLGGAVKTGILYNINNGKHLKTSNSIYLNAAYYSRAPYSGVYFASGNNHISDGVKNEKNLLGELGYRLIYGKGGMEATVYTAYWKNKSMMSNPYKPLEEDSYKFMITGLNALHYGVEIDAWHNFTRWMKLSAFVSAGSWKWKNNVNATIYDPYSGQVAQQINVYSNGLPIGDAPQTQIGANLEICPYKSATSEFNIKADWQYNSRYWADFDPATRTNPNDFNNPYRIPNYHLVNLGATWNQKIGKLNAGIFLNLNNLFNTYYIERGKDGKDHSQETFSGYWGQGRNFNLGLRLHF